MTRAADLWVLGNLTIDDLVLADGSTAMGVCGGNAIFAAVGGRLWSTHVALAARVGPDFPSDNLQQLHSAGIELALSRVNAPTIHNWALYESPDRRRFITRWGSGSHLEQSLIPAEVPAMAVVAGVCHVAPMPLEVQSSLVQFLAPAPTLVSLDPHEDYIDGAEDALLALLSCVDLFLPSQREAALLFGRDAPEDAARAFAACGPQVVAIKLGADGSLVCSHGVDPVHVPAVPVEALDPTGAGDAYCGGFAAKYAQGCGVLEAALHATVSASFVVERRGSLSGLPFDRSVAEQRLAWLRHALRT